MLARLDSIGLGLIPHLAKASPADLLSSEGSAELCGLSRKPFSTEILQNFSFQRANALVGAYQF